MTELKPLGYAASVLVLLLIVGYVAAMQWNPVLWAKSLRFVQILAWPGIWALGKSLGFGAWIVSKLAWSAYVLIEMWSQKLASGPWWAWKCLSSYCTKRAFYRPGHAA